MYKLTTGQKVLYLVLLIVGFIMLGWRGFVGTIVMIIANNIMRFGPEDTSKPTDT